jgi:hypothetical protein
MLEQPFGRVLKGSLGPAPADPEHVEVVVRSL